MLGSMRTTRGSNLFIQSIAAENKAGAGALDGIS